MPPLPSSTAPPLSFTDDAPIDPLELYASGIDESDYVAKVAPVIRAMVGEIGDLIDIGAGGGQLGQALRDPGASWLAIEPAPTMRLRLQRIAPPPKILPCGWREAEIAARACDTAMAANMPAPLDDPRLLLERCRGWARRTIVWLVPAQHGPRGLCLAGCLPREWHGEDETPGIDIVLDRLGMRQVPDRITTIDWDFRLTTRDLDRLAGYLCDRLGWAPGDARRPLLREHLAGQAEPVGTGLRLSVPRKSAILVWRLR